MCTTGVCFAYRGQKMVSGLLEEELQMVESYQVELGI